MSQLGILLHTAFHLHSVSVMDHILVVHHVSNKHIQSHTASVTHCVWVAKFTTHRVAGSNVALSCTLHLPVFCCTLCHSRTPCLGRVPHLCHISHLIHIPCLSCTPCLSHTTCLSWQRVSVCTLYLSFTPCISVAHLSSTNYTCCVPCFSVEHCASQLHTMYVTHHISCKLCFSVAQLYTISPCILVAHRSVEP